MTCVIRSKRSGLNTLMGLHTSPGLWRGCSVASWGHQCPKLEGGYHLPWPYSHIFSDPISLATLPGPKRRRSYWPPGVFRLCSSMWVPPSEDRRVPIALWSVPDFIRNRFNTFAEVLDGIFFYSLSLSSHIISAFSWWRMSCRHDKM